VYKKQLPLHTFQYEEGLTSSLLKSQQTTFSRYFLLSSPATRPLQSTWVSQPRADSRPSSRDQMVTIPISNRGQGVSHLLCSVSGKCGFGSKSTESNGNHFIESLKLFHGLKTLTVTFNSDFPGI